MIDQYFYLKSKLLEYFNYPKTLILRDIVDCRTEHWKIDVISNCVLSAENKEGLVNEPFIHEMCGSALYTTNDELMVEVFDNDGNHVLQIYNIKNALIQTTLMSDV